ncbi:uncharacterized protein LOC123244519 [Gracilinanus agilis]|uniref:uncharacterized protein LOC123244519 n=1 Tax=Gracilinanus agilis TaxID=191870 RepID=UPI001CFD9F63|nr:uncharacterized protein LOC123244519 [Gracilinanus agilis]
MEFSKDFQELWSRGCSGLSLPRGPGASVKSRALVTGLVPSPGAGAPRPLQAPTREAGPAVHTCFLPCLRVGIGGGCRSEIPSLPPCVPSTAGNNADFHPRLPAYPVGLSSKSSHEYTPRFPATCHKPSPCSLPPAQISAEHTFCPSALPGPCSTADSFLQGIPLEWFLHHMGSMAPVWWHLSIALCPSHEAIIPKTAEAKRNHLCLTAGQG